MLYCRNSWSDVVSMITGDEREVESVYRVSGFNTDTPAPMMVLVKGILGPDSLRIVPASSLPGDAALAKIKGCSKIFLRKGLSPERARFAVAHELAHYVLGIGSNDPRGERACDAFAAKLIAPARAYQKAIESIGDRYGVLAKWFTTSESCVALRLGEVTGTPLALVTTAEVRLRGSFYSWGEASDVRSLAARRHIPGIKKAKLHDQSSRITLMVL